MRDPGWGTVAIGVRSGFLCGAITVAVLTLRSSPALPPVRQEVAEAQPSAHSQSEVVKPPVSSSSVPPIGLAATTDLRNRRLEFPVRGVSRATLTDSFHDARTGGHHEAIDILAPRNTPVVAVEDGTIAKLFQSKAGGTTIYQFDPTSTYAYYYAHLERYVDNLREGLQVRRGNVLGYVGTSGNAPKNTPHLHFAIFRLGSDKKWWQGTAIDPYEVLR